MSFDRLIAKIIETKNPTVVGLDPKLDYVPEYIKNKYFEEDGFTLKAAAKAIFKFNQKIIDEICDIVPAIKPQAAYYEMYGHYGIKTLEKTIRYAKLKGMFVITDGMLPINSLYRSERRSMLSSRLSVYCGSAAISVTSCLYIA